MKQGMAQAHPIFYTICPIDPAAHLFRVTLRVAAPDPQGQRFSLPAWIPGSYMIREFARNIVTISAHANDDAIAFHKRDKHTWQAAACTGPLTLSYDIYAWDLSVRTAHLDQTHGFFNGTSVFLQVHGQEAQPHVVDIQPPADPALENWRVATTLPELAAAPHAFGSYIAANYDELIDHPVEMGTFELGTFEAAGIPHEIAVTGQVPNLDMDRLSADLRRICETQIAFFHGEGGRAPMSRYLFQVMAVGSGYGGLEHRSSTALLCSRNDLPARADRRSIAENEAYQNFLGLCSHEYFHSWHVKRIRPAAFAPYDLQNENYTRLLWLFEGFTSYYDDLMLVRSGLINESTYLNRIANTLNTVNRASGRKKQSIAEASFDAWTKFYRQDENAPNALVNYYTKGSLVALALDLSIRIRTSSERSLDDGMRLLWERYGHNYEEAAHGIGIPEEEAEAVFEEASGLDLKTFFARFVHGTDELQLGHLLEHFGITEASTHDTVKASLNIRVQRAANDCRIVHVYEGGAGHQAGLSAGDVLLAIDGIRVPGENATKALEQLLSRYAVGDRVTVHVFRRDELQVYQATLEADDTPRFRFTIASDTAASALEARKAWLQLPEVRQP